MEDPVQQDMIEFLGKLVAMPSISAESDRAPDSLKTAEFIRDAYANLGFEIKIVDNAMAGKNPLIMGKLGNDASKKTLMYYSHYDVQPASYSDGWSTEPFEMTPQDDGYLYGRGTNDDKGPIVATYYAIKKLLDEGGVSSLPVNLAILYEGEEESSSGGFEDTVQQHRDFYDTIDGIMILDTSWFSDHRPSVDYGFRGMSYMAIEIRGPKKDQHSGLVGGTIREPMTDLSHIFSKLITLEGKVLVDGFYDDVLPLEAKEQALYDDIEFDLQGYKDYLGRDSLLHDDATTTLMNMWRNPALSIHGIEGAFYGPGGKTVVPGKVIGKVSMRLVPNQDPVKIAELFTKYVEKVFAEMKSPNELIVHTHGTGDWWYGQIDNFLFESAKTAIEDYWDMTPNYARSGGSIPIIPFMEKLFSAPAIGMGTGQSSDGAHSQNERIRVKNLVGAKEVLYRIMKLIGN
ncbi:MAG: M20/M25/M40 family metallo-hydrolase [Candidatus Kariarchaeaceae archaeon]|jgi:acetylornithine deacetylase/succinyl-diaminopimelate desuccinylase-like protein